MAIGTPPGDPHGWPVGIKHPGDPAGGWRSSACANRAMATSGATYQHFDYNDRKLGHLLDPRTGRPAEGVALATAFAPTAAEADALATAFYVLGVELARAYCDAHPDVGAVLLPR